MRLAYRVWSGIAGVVFAVVAITDLSSTAATTSASSVSPATTTSPARPTPGPAIEPAGIRVEPVGTQDATASGEVRTVTRVIDGDTLEVTGGRTVQIIAIDACELGTHGGDQAAESARIMLEGESVTLTRAPGVTTDRRGNDLRFVASSYGGDFGEFAVRAEHTAPYAKHGAPADYLRRLRDADDGPQRCVAPAPPGGGGDGGGSIDWPTPGDQGLPDGAFTGGYCARKWWC